MGENIFFQNVCRICTTETSGIPIYSEEGKKNSLEEKIKKFLSITVTEEDILPKMVCLSCSSKLESMDEFASMAAKMQTKLLECLNSRVPEDTNFDNEKQEERMALWQSQFLKEEKSKDETTSEKETTESNSEEKEDGQGSLLHSILTKGQQNEGDVTELEVRIDPMLFLQEEEDEDEEDDDDDDEDDDSPHSNDDSLSSRASSSPSNENTDSNDRTENGSSKLNAKPYQCALCPKTFSNDLSLQNHHWTHLPPARRKILVTSDLNSALRESGIPQQLQWKCPICFKQISTKSNLKVHLETHMTKGKHTCDICGRVFQTQTNLYRHKLYHSGSQCLCQVCGRVYPTRSTLRAHQITHSNLRPHKCSLCDKTFKRNQDLKFHINQHTGERPYRCPYCPKAFASSGNCFSHRKRMHPKQLARDRTTY